MSGFVSMGNSQYLGTFKNAEVAGVENGQFVVLDYVAKTGALANATTGDGDVFFVANEIYTVDEQGIDDVNFKVANGKYLRLHKPHTGEILVTTKFNGTLAEGAIVAVGVNGNVEAVAARTPKVKFVIKEKTNEYGVETLRLLVL